MNDLPKRKQIRLKDYDYSNNGYYFITICTKDRQHLLCEIVGGSIHDTPNVQLTKIGGVVENTIEYINDKSNAKIDNYIIMPNHIHLIAVIDNVGSGFMPDRIKGTAQDRSLQYGIPEIVRDLKSMVMRDCVDLVKQNKLIPFHKTIWQKSYHDHIIRNEQEYQKICEYIENNPLKWEMDCYYKTGGRRL